VTCQSQREGGNHRYPDSSISKKAAVLSSSGNIFVCLPVKEISVFQYAALNKFPIALEANTKNYCRKKKRQIPYMAVRDLLIFINKRTI
jgi:hypothetical protein